MGLFDIFRKTAKDDVAKELDQIRQRQRQEPDSTPGEAADESGILIVEDVFSITGRGTVVTGTISAGTFNTGDRVEIIRLDGTTLITTVTGLEAFRKLLTSARQGDNVGMLLKGIGRSEISRGDTVRRI